MPPRLALLLVFACSHDAHHSPDAAGDGPTPDALVVGPIDDFCAALPAAVCAFDVRCGIAQAVDSCEAVLADDETFARCYGPQRESYAAGRLAFDGDQATACLAALRTGSACPSAAPLDDLAACQGLFHGHVTAGGACSIDDDCGADAFCSAACPGTCTPRIAVGAAATRDRECAPGLYLYAGSCRAPAAAGASCAPVGGGSYQHCAAGTYCDRYGSLRCVASHGIGEPCPTGFECAGLLQCTQYGCERIKLEGQACTRPLSQSSPPDGRTCAFDLFCDTPPNNLPGTCAARRAVNGLCFASTDCTAGLLCAGAGEVAQGTCIAPPGLGQPCAQFIEGSCAQGLFCPLNGDPQCRSRVAEGGACTDGAGRECQPGLACTNAVCAVPWCRL